MAQKLMRHVENAVTRHRTEIQISFCPAVVVSFCVPVDVTTVVSKIWNGRANLAQLETDGKEGHLQVMSLRLYNPQPGQWSLYAASSRNGTLSVPTVGEFKDGRGEFFDQETFNGRSILVRNVWSDITPDSCRFEQAFSNDGGKTWEVNWIAVDTRVKDQSDRRALSR